MHSADLGNPFNRGCMPLDPCVEMAMPELSQSFLFILLSFGIYGVHRGKLSYSGSAGADNKS